MRDIKHEYKNTSLFADINDVPSQYPWLSVDEECEVLIIGGGITGTLCLYHLSECGVDTVLVSQKPIGYSSSCVNSSSLQYQNELMLTDFSKTVGKDKALNYFKMCEEALDDIEELSTKLENFDFVRRDGFLYTACAEHVDKLHTEYLMRRHNGFDVEFLEKTDARELFSFEIQAGILARNLAGEVDGYKFCHALTSASNQNGARVFENTTITAIEYEDDYIIAKTSYGKKIRAKKIVMATGYQQEEYLNKEVIKKTSFTLATKPVKSFAGYDTRAVVRNIDNNIHLRTTKDNRIIISGLDCCLVDKKSRLAKVIGIDRLVDRKYTELEKELENMLIGIDDLEVEYQFDGQYAQTNDMLPVVSEFDEYKDIYFAMPTSLNGILYSQIIAKSILEKFCNIVNK